MKKTLLFLMGVSLTFFSQACVEETHRSEHHQIGAAKFMIASAMVSTMRSCLKTMNKKSSRLESSPTSVARMIYTQDKITSSSSATLKRQVSFQGDENSSKTLALRRPDSLLSQHYAVNESSSDAELSALAARNSSNGMLRVHSSQRSNLNLCDHPSPDLGKTPTDHITPDLGKTPESDTDGILRSSSYDSERSRARSTSSDFYIGSTSYSPGKQNQRQRLGILIRQCHMTPDLGEESPRAK